MLNMIFCGHVVFLWEKIDVLCGNCDVFAAAWEELRVDGAEDTTVTIRPLDAGEYCVKVKSTSFIGDSHFTEPLKHLVFRTGNTLYCQMLYCARLLFVNVKNFLELYLLFSFVFVY